MQLSTRTPLATGEPEALQARFDRVRTLEDLVRLLPTQRGAALVEIVTQDEYTHDVIVTWPRKDAAPHYLVFDTS